MIDALFSPANLVATQRLLDTTELRQEAIIQNLANIETPGYRRVDIASSFEAQLKQAVSSRDEHALEGLQPFLAPDPNAVARRRDGNSVDLEGELVKLNRNGLEHAVESQMLSGMFLKIRQAITGRSQ